MSTDNYERYREVASKWLESYSDELATKYGYTFGLHTVSPLLDMLAAYFMMQGALERLGGREAVAYTAAEADAALLRKVGRLLLQGSQDVAESADRALRRHQSERRNEIENAFHNHRRTGQGADQRRLFEASDKETEATREWIHAALDRFVDEPPRRW